MRTHDKSQAVIYGIWINTKRSSLDMFISVTLIISSGNLKYRTEAI
jgi:hypothetical protein